MEGRSSSLELNPKSLDPIFTPKFYTKPQIEGKEEKVEPITFSLPPGKTESEFAKKLQEFIKSAEGEKFKAGVKNIVQQIQAIIKSWSMNEKTKQKWLAELDQFFERRFVKQVTSDEETNETLFSLYTEGVVELNNLLHKIKNDQLPLSLRQRILHNLLDKDELQRCPPGVAGFIQDSSSNLSADVSSILMTARHEVALQVANEQHLGQDSNHHDHAQGMEAHYARYFSYSYAHALQTSQPWDHYFNNLDEEKANNLLSSCVGKLPSALTLENILVHIGQRFDLAAIAQNLQEYFDALRGETTEPLLVFGAQYQSQLERLRKQLDEYGVDDDWVTENFFECDYEEKDNQKHMKVVVRPGAQKTLEATLIDRLFLQGYLAKEQRVKVNLGDDELCLLLGSHNFNLSYVKKRKAKEYVPFSTYYATLNATQKQKIFTRLIKIVQQLTLPSQRDLFMALGHSLDGQTGDFYLQCLKAKAIGPLTKSEKGLTPILIAASKGYVAVIEYLVSEAPETLVYVDKNGSKPLHVAAKNGQTATMHYLVNQCHVEVDAPNHKGRTPLWYAAKKGHLDSVKWLIRKGAKVSPEIKKFLMEFVEKERMLFLAWLQKKIIDPTTSNKDGVMPIHIAAKKGYVDVMTQLVSEFKEAADQVDTQGSRPLHFAAQENQVAAMEYLVDTCKVFVDVLNFDGFTPLYNAATSGHVAATEWLIKQGAAIDRKYPGNKTLLEKVLAGEKFAVADVLLVAGAKLSNHRYKQQKLSNHALQKEKLDAFQAIPRSVLAEEKASRSQYLGDFRRRTLAAYQGNTQDAVSIRNALKKELLEFKKLDIGIQKLRSLIRDKIHGKKVEALKEKAVPLTDVFEEAYKIFYVKKTAHEAIGYVTTHCRNILMRSFDLSTQTTSTVFSKQKTFRGCCEDVLDEMGKQATTSELVYTRKVRA